MGTVHNYKKTELKREGMFFYRLEEMQNPDKHYCLIGDTIQRVQGKEPEHNNASVQSIQFSLARYKENEKAMELLLYAVNDNQAMKCKEEKTQPRVNYSS